MNRVRFFGLLAAGFLICNLVLIGFIFLKMSDNRPRHQEPKNIIIKKLHFNKEQVAAYEELIQWHRSEIRKNEKQIMDLKTKLYSGIAENSDSEANDSLIQQLADEQKEIEQIHYRHFQDIKKICREDQQQYFKELTDELAKLFSPKHPKERRP